MSDKIVEKNHLTRPPGASGHVMFRRIGGRVIPIRESNQIKNPAQHAIKGIVEVAGGAAAAAGTGGAASKRGK